MNWETLLKAQFLPGMNAVRWAEILSSEQSVSKFVRELNSDDYPTKGINTTLKFIREKKFDSLQTALFSRDIDEDDARNRYEAIAALLEKKLSEKSKVAHGHREVPTDKFTESMEKISEQISSGKKPNVKLLALVEKFIREHPMVMRRLRRPTREKHLPVIGEWVKENRTYLDKMGLRPRPQYTKEKKRKTIVRGGQEQMAGTFSKNRYALEDLFRVQGEEAQTKQYEVLGWDWDKTKTFYKTIASRHRDLIPRPVLESGLISKSGKSWSLHPYLAIVFESNSLEGASRDMNQKTVNALYAQMKSTQDKEVFEQEMGYLFNHNNRVFNHDFKEWLLEKQWSFDDGAMIDGEDKSSVKFSPDDQKVLLNLSEGDFEDKGEYVLYIGNFLDVMDKVWKEAIETFYVTRPRKVNTIRENKSGLDGAIENFTPGPLSPRFQDRDMTELLKALYSAGESFGLGETEPTRAAFTALYDNIQEKMSDMGEEKLNEIVQNQVRYKAIKNLFSLLIKHGFIREVEA